MQVDSEDRYVEEEPTASLPILPIVIAVAALAGIAGWYFYGGNSTDTPSAAQNTSAPAIAAQIKAPEPELAPAPDIPQVMTEPEPETAQPNEPVAVVPQYTLETSDPVIREQLSSIVADTPLSNALAADDLIARGTALVDAASQGNISKKLLPIPAPKGSFAVRSEDDTLYTDPQSYARYDSYAKAISSLDTNTLAATFHTFRPLLEQSYSALGYKAEDLDNALIKALDQILAAPVLANPAVLEKQITTYKYADESLEKLSPLAKQLMRMGPENQVLIQKQASALREQLLGN